MFSTEDSTFRLQLFIRTFSFSNINLRVEKNESEDDESEHNESEHNESENDELGEDELEHNELEHNESTNNNSDKKSDKKSGKFSATCIHFMENKNENCGRDSKPGTNYCGYHKKYAK